MLKPLSAKAAAREVARWNAKCPIGTSVRVWTGPREGPGELTTARTPAEVNAANVPVQWFEGHGSCIALSHVEIVPAEWLDLSPEGGWWLISVASYGAFLYGGTEADAEGMRVHKARWEQAAAKKRLATPEEIAANRPGASMSEDWGKFLARQEAP